MKWVEQRTTADMRAVWEREMPGQPIPHVFSGVKGGRKLLYALVGLEEIAPGDKRWHISVSAPGRVPTWGEMSAACHELRPGVPFALGVPPKSWWINLHEHVLHAWEIRDEHLLAQWRAEASGHTPTPGDHAEKEER